MSQITRRFITLSVLTVALGAAIGFDLHRVLLQAVSPIVQDFWFTYIAF